MGLEIRQLDTVQKVHLGSKEEKEPSLLSMDSDLFWTTEGEI